MFMPDGYVAVSNGKSNGRSFYDPLMEGKIVIQSPEFKRIVSVKDGQIAGQFGFDEKKRAKAVGFGREISWL